MFSMEENMGEQYIEPIYCQVIWFSSEHPSSDDADEKTDRG